MQSVIKFNLLMLSFVIISVHSCYATLYSGNDDALQKVINKYTEESSLSSNKDARILSYGCKNTKMELKNIYSIGSNSQATIEYNDGSLFNIKEGDNLACGEHIEKITLDSVKLKVDNRTIFLLVPEAH